ncbi:hypothetical protein QJS10_CPA02g00647 [Acorus calamus]|uniref:Uncharacterized protein n=1 Tax=Acorus calamus TaxID=4465 RepID=A0AAV9FE74_ACOCL|nr:hypothetical protein QJS10_CPA02g00647 [Acorus calamus]
MREQQRNESDDGEDRENPPIVDRAAVVHSEVVEVGADACEGVAEGVGKGEGVDVDELLSWAAGGEVIAEPMRALMRERKLREEEEGGGGGRGD